MSSENTRTATEAEVAELYGWLDHKHQNHPAGGWNPRPHGYEGDYRRGWDDFSKGFPTTKPGEDSPESRRETLMRGWVD